MTLKRVGAVAAAVVLILGAFLVRRVVIDDDDADASTGTVPATTAAPAAAAAVVCSTELAAACAAVEEAHPGLTVTVEPAGTTLDRLAQLPDDADAPIWFTIAPYPAMADSIRVAAGLEPFGGTAEVVAATPLAIATPGGRAEVLTTACAATPLWRCIGDNAGSPWTALGGEEGWSTVRPSLGVVERDAMALASFAAAVAGYLGTPDVSRSAWEADPSFIPWLRRLARAVDPTALSAGTPLATMATRPALDIAATSDAERTGLGATSERFDASYPEPSMWLEAVLAVPDRAAGPDDLAIVAARALAAAAWDDPSATTQPLPGAPTMLALRSLWQEAT